MSQLIFQGEAPLGGAAKQVTVGKNADGRMELFYAGLDDLLYHNWQGVPNGPFQGQAPLGGAAKQIAVGSNADGRIEVFYVGPDDCLYHNWQGVPNGPFQGESSLGGAAKQIVVGSNADGRMEVFHIGTDDLLYHNWQGVPNGPFQGESSLGGAAKQIVVGSNADGRMEVFYIGTDDLLYHNWQGVSNGPFQGESCLGGAAKQIVVGSNADGRMEVFHIGTDDLLYHNWQGVPNGPFQGQVPLGGAAKQIAVGSNADGRMEVFYIGMNGLLYHNWQAVLIDPQELQNNIVTATETLNASFGCGAGGCAPSNTGENLNESQVNSFFAATAPWDIDCLGAARIMLARGLILTLGPGKFDNLGYTSSTMHVIPRPIATAGEMLIGEWAYFQNDLAYLQKHPGGGYQGENVIKVSQSEYYGFPGGKKTAQQWVQELINAYDAGLAPSEWINTVPGFLGQANACFDVQAVCADLVKLREVTGVWSGTVPVFSREARVADMSKEYEAVLHALGAVPVSALDKKFWGDETGRSLYLKGQRVDVNGWIAPHWIKEGTLSFSEEKERAAAPLTFAQYVSLLDVEGYAATKEPLRYAVIAIALDKMLMEGAQIENPDVIIKVYEAGIGLEDRALRLLKSRVSSDRAMQLYNKHGDSRLLDVFPVPRAQETNYIQFLREVATKESEKGWLALSLLYAMDNTAYKEEFRDSLINRVRAVSNWAVRAQMCDALAGIGDRVSLDFLAGCLLTEPVTEVREAILRAAIARTLCSKELVRSVVQLARGFGQDHRPVTSSRMGDQWKFSLREYLTWAKNSNICETDSRVEAENALGLLNR